jgi:hypothetical protein
MKLQVSTIYPYVQPFVSKEAYLLWKLMTKGERLDKDMKTWEVGFGQGYGQRGINIDELRRMKILGKEKHKSRGSKLMNF